MKQSKFTRPSLDQALAAWRKCLASHALPEKPLWIFQENLCIEPSPTAPGSFHFGFQTKFKPPEEDALEIAYDEFSRTGARLVFYRLGSCPRGSVCILLCDSWFEEKGARDGFERHDEWGISFYPGHVGDIDEVTDLKRWLHRVKRDRAFHDFDFAMELAVIDEIRAEGRTLQPYERFARRMLGRLRQVIGSQE
jgi:hypothetical protein